MPVRSPRRSVTAANASTGVLPAPAPNRRVDPSICLAPARAAMTELATPRPRFSWPWKPTWASSPSSLTSAAIRSLTPSRISAPAESTTYTHWAPASAMIRACLASTSGGWLCAIIRKPTVSRPSFLARPKCWTEMSASVQWVAIRQTDAPLSAAAWMSSARPTPGSMRNAIFARLAEATAVLIRSCSGVRLKP